MRRKREGEEEREEREGRVSKILILSLFAHIVPVAFLTKSAFTEIGIALFFIFAAEAKKGKAAVCNRQI